MESFLRNVVKISKVILIIGFISLGFGMTTTQKAYLNDEFIGYVDSRKTVKEVYNEILDEAKESFTNVEEGRNIIRIEATNDSGNELTTKETMKNNIILASDISIDGYNMLVDGKSVGYVDSFQKGDEIINAFKDEAIKVSNISTNELVGTSVQGEVAYTKERIEIGKLKDSFEIIQDIKAKKHSKKGASLIDIEVLEVTKDIEEIMPTIKEITSENLYLGEEKVFLGEKGTKEVKKKNVYIDGEIVKTEVLDESVLVKPTETILYKGIQNPITSGVAFLSYPGKDRTVTSNYGKRWGNEHHSGVDLAGKTGDRIEASFTGKVKYSGWMNGYGNVVILDHGKGIETLYAHASKLTCATGQRVNKGDKIAEVGSTGRSTGPHIHFELRHNGKAINPITYLK